VPSTDERPFYQSRKIDSLSVTSCLHLPTVAIDAAAEVFAVDSSRISTAISYHRDYSDEINMEIAEAAKASARSEAAWRVQQF
jgi:hypothetical protein